MGHTTAAGLAEFGTAGLRAHLASNLFPPPPPTMVRVAQEALEVAKSAGPFPEGFLFEDILDERLDLPEGVSFRDRDWISARDAITFLHLDAFIDFEAGQTDPDFPQTEEEAVECPHGNRVWFGHECGLCEDTEEMLSR
jgi:hypothetical protein